MVAYKKIKSLDAESFAKHREKTGDTICGYRPIFILLKMLSEFKTAKAQLLAYDTSGNLTNDFQNSVSYLSIAFFRKFHATKLIQANFLNKSEQRKLLKLLLRLGENLG